MISGATSDQFVCFRCHKWYQFKRSLRRHLKYECGVNKGFSCPYCSRTTKQSYNLLVHVGKVHPHYLTQFTDYYKQMLVEHKNKP